MKVRLAGRGAAGAEGKSLELPPPPPRQPVRRVSKPVISRVWSQFIAGMRVILVLVLSE